MSVCVRAIRFFGLNASNKMIGEVQSHHCKRFISDTGRRNVSQCRNNKHKLVRINTYLVGARYLHTTVTSLHDEAHDVRVSEPQNKPFQGNPRLDFPCISIDRLSGPEPEYDNSNTGYQVFSSKEPFHMKYNEGVLPELDIAYETWGTLNDDKSNAVLLATGLSASTHAKSHIDNMKPGWWEKFIGPGSVIDTNRFFVICYNNIGSCYGSSGPSSTNPITNERYGATFPIVSMDDIARSSMLLMDHLGINKVYASIGSSIGGMTSLATTALFPERVGRVISISACAKSHPTSIAFRFLQRRCIMMDQNWNNGDYYDKTYPKMGMKLAREVATMTYRSGPEWELRFGRDKVDGVISLCPTFMIERYLEHQGEMFSTKYDPNSLLYLSKAADLFDMSEGFSSLSEGLARITCPALIMGVQTDVLFPSWQQLELAQELQESNKHVTYYELNSMYGHDTFLLDLNGVGAGLKGFIEIDIVERGSPVRPILRK